MSDTKIFSLGDQGLGGGGLAPLIASLCQNRGLDPNMVAAMMNNNRGNGGWGDGSAWWIIILLIFGWGGFGNGFGGGFGGRGSAQGLADLGGLVNSDAGRQLIMQAIQGNATAISQLASTVHCDVNALQGAIANVSQSICQLGNQMGQSTNQVLTAIMQGNNGILSQLCDCCCGIKSAIADFKGDLSLQMCQQTNALTNTINNVAIGQERGFSNLGFEMQKQTNTLAQLVNDKFCAMEMREVMRENQALRDEKQQFQMSALLQQQSQNLLGQLQPVAKPAYLTCSPYQAHYGYPWGNPWGNNGCCNNNGCCGNNNGCGC